MKERLLLAAAIIPCFFIQLAFAQNARIPVCGKVVDSLSGKGVGYATAAFIGPDGAPFAAVAADSAGCFTLPADSAGSYTLVLSCVGYMSATHEISVRPPSTELGDIPLAAGVGIENVVVAVQKPLITADAEKITYSVEDDPETATGTLADIIRKIPQLSIDASGNVLLNGQSDYKILVNGHSSATMENNFKQFVESMPAGSVKKIEVITHPSTKYEAEGVGGIINIITVGRRAEGYNGSVNAAYSTGGNERGNVYFAVQTGKLALSASYYASGYRNRKPTVSESVRENIGNDLLSRIESSSRSSYKGLNQGFTLNASYQPDTLNLFTVELSTYMGRFRDRSSGATRAFDSAGRAVYAFDTRSTMRFPYNFDNISANVDYEHNFGKEDHTLTVSWELQNDPDKDYDDIETVTDGIVRTQRRKADNKGLNNTLQIDYFNPITDLHRIEAGVKYIHRNYRTDNVQSFEPPLQDPVIGATDYVQDILGVYAGYYLAGGKVSGHAGVRAEQSWNHVKTVEDGISATFSPELFNVIPYLSITYNPAEGHNLNLSYTQRIQRPGIWAMNPMRESDDPLNVAYGNPDLKSMVWHTVNLNYRMFKGNWNAMIGGGGFLSNDYITRYHFVDGQGVSNTTYGNIVRSRSIGLNGSVSYRTGTLLTVSLNFSGNYSSYKSARLGLHTDGFSFYANLSASVRLWKDATFYFNGNYYIPGSSFQTVKDSDHYYYSFGIRQQLWKKKIDLSITATNPFEKYRTNRTTTADRTFIEYSRTRWHSRGFTFSVGFRFGKNEVEVKSAARSIENDDLMSAGKEGQ